MAKFILRRVLISIPVLFIVITLVFFAFKFIPGDPARMYAGEEASGERVEMVRKELGLDQPVMVQYFSYLTRLFIYGDLGKSIMTRQPVIQEIRNRFWNTISLAAGAILVATTFGMLTGIISAIKRGKALDYISSVGAIFGISIPVFWLGLIMMFLFSVTWGILPTAGNATWKHYIMPTICLSVYSLAFISRMTRSTLQETIAEDYVRTARAKGLAERVVFVRHALRNALLPIITVVSLRFGYMIGGAVITETIFAWPGMGRLLITAVNQRDIPVVQGVLLIYAISFLVINLLVDITYAFVDPRIRHES